MITLSEELKLIRDKDIEEIINTLTKDYGMSIKCLSHLLWEEIDLHKFEFKAFLEVLIDTHKISADTIAKFAKIPTQYVLDFMVDSSTVPIELKYRLASVILYSPIIDWLYKTLWFQYFNVINNVNFIFSCCEKFQIMIMS